MGWNIGRINAPSLASTSLIRALPRYAVRGSSLSPGEMRGSLSPSPAPNGNAPEDVMRRESSPKSRRNAPVANAGQTTTAKIVEMRMFGAQLNIEFEHNVWSRRRWDGRRISPRGPVRNADADTKK